jgi:glycosyltransferase involved in cell wall biosynthesis
MKQLVVLVRCRNEERQLVNFLDMCGSVSDGVLLLDDNSSDNSLSIAKSHPAVLKAWKSYQDTSERMGEGCDYVSLLTIAQAYEPQWILILDVDERLEPEQFNAHKDKIFASEYNSVNLLWPFYDEISNKAVFWGYGPQSNKEQVKLKFKSRILMKFEDIGPVVGTYAEKPRCKNQRSGWCNIVLKHLCVRPAKERLEKWERRLPLETDKHLGYNKEILISHVDKLKRLPPDHPTYDKWLDSMIKEHGFDWSLNTSDFHIEDSPCWQMLLSHLPTASRFVEEGKQLIW